MLCLTPLTGMFLWDDLRKILPGCHQIASVPEVVEILPKILIALSMAHERYRQTTHERRTEDDI